MQDYNIPHFFTKYRNPENERAESRRQWRGGDSFLEISRSFASYSLPIHLPALLLGFLQLFFVSISEIICLIVFLFLLFLNRAFIEKNYKELKTNNPKLPILIREATGIEPQLWARFGNFFCVIHF